MDTFVGRCKKCNREVHVPSWQANALGLTSGICRICRAEQLEALEKMYVVWSYGEWSPIFDSFSTRRGSV